MCREVWVSQGNDFISGTVFIGLKVTTYYDSIYFFRLKQVRVVSRLLILCQGKVQSSTTALDGDRAGLNSILNHLTFEAIVGYLLAIMLVCWFRTSLILQYPRPKGLEAIERFNRSKDLWLHQ
jgi:hypothetical protein